MKTTDRETEMGQHNAETDRKGPRLSPKTLVCLGLCLAAIIVALVLFSRGSSRDGLRTVGGATSTPLPHIQATAYAQAVKEGACVAAPLAACDSSKPCGHRVGSSAGAACGDPTCGSRDYDPSACGGVQPCYYCCCGCCPNGCGGSSPTSTPTPTPTPTPIPAWSGSVVDDSGAPLSGVPVELRGRYDDCAGGTGEQFIASTLTAANGTYSLMIAMPPATGCGWQHAAIVEVLPWNSVYRPLSASAPPPGWVASAAEIRYPWSTTGSYGGNDFVVDLIPVDVTLSADYPYLVLRGPDLPPPSGPLPAQVLRGTYAGPLSLSGRAVDVYVWDGSTWDMHSTYTDAAGNYMIDAGLIGEPLFGTTLLGAWQAYAQVTVPGSGIYGSPDAFWFVRWFPVHQTE